MRRIFTALTVLFLFLLPGMSGYAATNVSVAATEPDAIHTAISVVDLTAGAAAETAIPVNDSVAPTVTVVAPPVPLAPAAVPVREIAPLYEPVNVDMAMENGVLVLKKTYETDPDFDPQALVETLENSGYDFRCREILRQELPGELLTRAASKNAVVRGGKDDAESIAGELPATLDFEENGFTGTLRLDPSSVVTEPEDFETYTYPYTDTREVGGLSRNDPSFLDKELDGMTLMDVSFSQDAGGLYTATADYSGTATGQRAVSHVATATYLGEITKEIPGSVQYTVIYEGTPITPEPVIPESEQTIPVETAPPATDPPEEPEPVAEATDAESEETAIPETPAAPNLTPYLAFMVGAGVIFLIGAVAVPLYITSKQKKEKEDAYETLEEIKQFIRRV